jgi:hypothetical protein
LRQLSLRLLWITTAQPSYLAGRRGRPPRQAPVAARCGLGHASRRVEDSHRAYRSARCAAATRPTRRARYSAAHPWSRIERTVRGVNLRPRRQPGGAALGESQRLQVSR